jgi:hypothetical protein
MTALSAWLHPISAVFPAVAMLAILAEDLRAGKGARATILLGAAAALAIAVPLAAPMLNDLGSLSAKAGGDFAGGYTLSRMLSLFAGGLPDSLTAVATLVAAYGAWRLYRRDARLAAYLATLALVPTAVFLLLGAKWTHQGHTFARYVFPVQLVFLLWFAIGAIEIVRAIARRAIPDAELAIAAALAAGYLAVNPAIQQVATLGPWYNHAYHQFDYVPMHNDAAWQYFAFGAPAFYHRLGHLPAGAAPIIEAPFTSGAPTNPLAFFRLFHQQPEKLGMLHDLCLDGGYVGEVPHDARFRFRNFVFLDDPASVLASGARYLVLNRGELHGRPFVEGDRCLAALERLYGKPVELGPRVAVFDLRPSASARKVE